MSVTDFPIPPLTKTVTFPGPVEAAFARFTAGIGDWWPLATHSLAAHSPGGPDQAVTARFERIAPGGALIEVWADGQTRQWGTIVACRPPAQLAFTWHVGRDPDSAQLIELTFESAADGQTRVTLVHSGWERLGTAGTAARESYDSGWTGVLQRYVQPG